MLNAIIIFSLVYSAANWVLFLLLTFVNDLPAMHKLIKKLSEAPESVSKAEAGAGLHLIDPTKLISAGGSLAGAFKKAGAAPTAAALSLVGLIVAVVAAGVGKI